MNLQGMINQGPEWLESYLREFEEGKPVPLNSMLGIFEVAEVRAISQNSLVWAGIAVRAAGIMALEDGGRHRHFALHRAMRVRARFISKIGSRPGDPVLDKDIIIRWFNDEMEFPIEVAKGKVAIWNNSTLPLPSRLPLSDLRALFEIRGRIRILQTLADCGELPTDASLTEWLEIERSCQLP